MPADFESDDRRAGRRSAQIRRVMLRHGAGAALDSRLGFASRGDRKRAVARHVRAACEELGPTFVKLGQVASVRADVFAPETLEELDRLRDDVGPLPWEAVRAVMARELGADPEVVFVEVDPVPLGSASIAQVHRAVLREPYRPVWGEPLAAGTALAVKVVRPGARESVAADMLAARAALARLPRFGTLARMDLGALVDELEASLGRELDMRTEGRTADRFAFDFREDAQVQIPRIVWPATTRSVLTMEFVEGWPLTRLDEARAAGVDTKALAEHGAQAFMRQVLVYGRFHADLHHANLLVTPDSRFAYLDFGMVGTLDDAERRAVAGLLAAITYRDPVSALTYTERLGVEVPQQTAAALVADLGKLMDRTLDPSGEGSDVKDFGLGLLSLLRKYGVSIPGGYALLVKALVTVEGVSRQLYPDIDMMRTAAPFATEVMLRQGLTSGRLAERAEAAWRAAILELIRD
jgi:ubiquinone biosynthesis protein